LLHVFERHVDLFGCPQPRSGVPLGRVHPPSDGGRARWAGDRGGRRAPPPKGLTRDCPRKRGVGVNPEVEGPFLGATPEFEPATTAPLVAPDAEHTAKGPSGDSVHSRTRIAEGDWNQTGRHAPLASGAAMAFPDSELSVVPPLPGTGKLRAPPPVELGIFGVRPGFTRDRTGRIRTKTYRTKTMVTMKKLVGSTS